MSGTETERKIKIRTGACPHESIMTVVIVMAAKDGEAPHRCVFSARIILRARLGHSSQTG